MMIVTLIASILAIIGCLNWLLVGLFSFNLVTALFGAASILSTAVYILVGIAGIWLAFYLIYSALRSDDRSTARRQNTSATRRAKV